MAKKSRSSSRTKKSGSKSKSRSSRGKSNPWIKAVAKARKELGVTGFMAVKKGTPLYNRAKAIYGGM